jgi:hypothetical protein
VFGLKNVVYVGSFWISAVVQGAYETDHRQEENRILTGQAIQRLFSFLFPYFSFLHHECPLLVVRCSRTIFVSLVLIERQIQYLTMQVTCNERNKPY